MNKGGRERALGGRFLLWETAPSSILSLKLPTHPGHLSLSLSSTNSTKIAIYSKMVQTSILRYITSDRQHLATSNKSSILLRLPFDIRRRVYEYAGLSDGTFISLNYLHPDIDVCPQTYDSLDLEKISADGSEDSDGSDEHDNCISRYSQTVSRFLNGPMPYPDIQLERPCCVEHENPTYCNCTSSLPSQLLDVCRTISNEANQIFYSESHFTICRSDLGGLSGLFSLKPRALSWMSSLCIRLNICDCGYAPEFCTSKDSGNHEVTSHESCVRGHEDLLRKPTFQREIKAMAEWKRLCRHLAASTTPKRLRLCVICDVADVEAAKQIVEPMLELPILRECTLRFGLKARQEELQELARKTVLKLTGRTITGIIDTPFRFMDLPREIQLHILRYTDLVSPKDLAWCPDQAIDGYRVVQSSSIRWQLYSSTTAYEYFCCGSCSSSDATESCCCTTRHTGFLTTCECWTMPTALFSVSRRMKEDATSIFFSRNHFAILPPRFPKVYDEPLEILRFLTGFAVRGRRHLQSITWMLPEFAYPVRGTRGHTEWDKVVDICVQEMSTCLFFSPLNISQVLGHSKFSSFPNAFKVLASSNTDFKIFQVCHVCLSRLTSHIMAANATQTTATAARSRLDN